MILIIYFLLFYLFLVVFPGIINPNSPQQKILINTACLERFLCRVVKSTENFTVERLLQLYSYLQQCVYKYRKELDKKELLKVINFV